MSPIRLSLFALTLVTVAFAGCATKATDDSGTTGVDGIDVAPTATTGIIRGVVVDTAVRPLANVHLSLKVGDRTMTTDSIANGGFGFEGLPPGTYFVTATKLGFNTVGTSAEVTANDANPPLAKISMEANPSTKPYLESYVFKGIIECSGTFVVVGAALCSVPNEATCGLDPVPCSPNVTNDNTQVHYQVARVPSWVQSEMVWQSTQALGTDLSLMYSYDCGETLYCDHEVSGVSPLLLAAGPEDIQKIGIGNSTDVYIRVFNSGTAESMGRAGLTLEQDFTIYTQVFYGFQPPEGYRFSKDGDAKVPA
ncbi:MAG TPA: carboxypeptidase-like regulatory domain-containing protein [Candidatus Thermoplasmatota archaeon]|nr:carboxypeptidase-like regulatory domain-containing protein [Candidatus Thermoplasmatota archaeon]